MENLEQLIERVTEIRRRLQHLSDSMPSAEGDADALRRIDEERKQLHAELVTIGEQGMSQIDDPIVRNAVGHILDAMRADAEKEETPAQPTEEAPAQTEGDALEQARAIIDAHAQELHRSTEALVSDVVPMVERALNHHAQETDAGQEHAGIDLFAMTIDMSEQHDNGTGMVGVSISHLRGFGGPDELMDLVAHDEACSQLAQALNHRLHALALVAYGRHIPVDDDGTEHRDQATENKVTTIIHPTGMVAYVRDRIGDTYGEPDKVGHLVTDPTDAEQLDTLVERHGRIPYALAYLYAGTLQHIINNR
jgi:hypothetical protein